VTGLRGQAVNFWLINRSFSINPVHDSLYKTKAPSNNSRICSIFSGIVFFECFRFDRLSMSDAFKVNKYFSYLKEAKREIHFFFKFYSIANLLPFVKLIPPQ